MKIVIVGNTKMKPVNPLAKIVLQVNTAPFWVVCFQYTWMKPLLLDALTILVSWYLWVVRRWQHYHSLRIWWWWRKEHHPHHRRTKIFLCGVNERWISITSLNCRLPWQEQYHRRTIMRLSYLITKMRIILIWYMQDCGQGESLIIMVSVFSMRRLPAVHLHL